MKLEGSNFQFSDLNPRVDDKNFQRFIWGRELAKASYIIRKQQSKSKQKLHLNKRRTWSPEWLEEKKGKWTGDRGQ